LKVAYLSNNRWVRSQGASDEAPFNICLKCNKYGEQAIQ